MPETVLGLPLHPLVVHATVVVVPTAAAMLAATLLSARLRRWAGLLPLLLAVAAVVLAPLATSTGESLERVVGESSLVERHAELGEMLVWWCVGLLVVAAASYLVSRNRVTVSRAVSGALVALGLAAAAGTLVQVALVGHSGAKAVWGSTVPSAGAAQRTGED